MAKGDVLSLRQEKFAAAYLETGSAAEAYRRVYKVDAMKPETIQRRGYELLQNSKIAALIAQHRQQIRQSVKITLEDHLTTLKDLRDGAKELGQFSAAVKAEEQRGKASGIYVAAEADELEIRGMSREDVLAELAEVRRVLDEYAHRSADS